MNPVQPITVAQYGIGPIGAEIARLLLTKPWLRVVAAVDVDPNKIGKDLGEVIGLDRQIGVKVTRELTGKADVVCHSTGSRLRDVSGQLKDLLERGCHVVSTCEELSFPLDQQIREELQQTARSRNVTLLGTGVNPGFVMDKLPLTVTSVCQRIDSVEIIRIQNASTRREPLQRKVGAGMTQDEFRAAVAAGKIKHMGLRESLMMVGKGLGAEFESVPHLCRRPGRRRPPDDLRPRKDQREPGTAHVRWRRGCGGRPRDRARRAGRGDGDQRRRPRRSSDGRDGGELDPPRRQRKARRADDG